MKKTTPPTEHPCDERSPPPPKSSAPRRVLIIAAAFPPTGGPGVQRSAKFAKYLPRFGWLPTVWALDRWEGLPCDPTLSKDIPAEVLVHRFPDPLAKGRMDGFLRSLTRSKGVVGLAANALQWHIRALREARMFPDTLASWARAGMKPLAEVVSKERIDAIFSTFSPASNHLLGLMLKRRTGLAWVADFRDLWTDDYRYREPSPRARHEHQKLETKILEEADTVIGVSRRQTDILARRVPHLRHKFVTITNGFDPADFENVPVHTGPDRERFVLGFVGRFDRWVVSDALLGGIRRFAEGLGAPKGRFLLRLVGHIGADIRRKLDANAVPYVHTGHLLHREAIAEMMSMDALLLCVPQGHNGDSTIPGKLFECLASRKPILVVGPLKSECADIVRSCEAGMAAASAEHAVCEALNKLYQHWNKGQPIPGCREEFLKPYRRVESAARLAQLLHHLVDSQAPHRDRSAKAREVCTG